MDERRKLLMKLSACQFAQTELVQFLDTHPDCVQAMRVLNMHRANACRLREQYEAQFGALSSPEGNGKRWTWIMDPWPWEFEGSCQWTPAMGARRRKGGCR